MNIGVYCAAGPNPIFLRLFMAQIARQTVLPNFLSVYENGNKTSAFGWACDEIVRELTSKGVNILHQHSPVAANSSARYFEALKPLLYTTETDIFLKMDLDDFYSDDYVKNMSGMLGDNDWVINLNSGITLIRPFHGDFKYKESVVMKHSPLGAAPSHVAFNRDFGNKYLSALAGAMHTELADDEVMAELVIESKVGRIDGPVDYVYVSHGNNHSSYAWQCSGGKIYL
jgi:hypothetical protein